MKQTKPYGRAFDPPGRAGVVEQPRQFVEEKHPRAELHEDDDGPRAARLEYTPIPVKPPKKLSKFARFLIHCVLLVLGSLVYVSLRDSLFAQNFITMVTNKETVMTCIRGEMHYQGWSLWDRVRGNGRFICTEWKVQDRFINLPRF